MWHLWVFSSATPVSGVWMPFTMFISPCQTVALTRGCWSKRKRWSCRASLQQRLGICKMHFNCSARQLRSCLSEPRLITTEHRPCGCEGTQQVPATDSTVNHSKQHGVRHIRLSSPSPAWRRIRPGSCQTLGTVLWCSFSLLWKGYKCSEDMRESLHLQSRNSWYKVTG